MQILTVFFLRKKKQKIASWY